VFVASLATALLVFAAGASVLTPVITGLGIEASLVAISEAVTEILIGLAAAFAP
jgi:hypothetical protein